MELVRITIFLFFLSFLILSFYPGIGGLFLADKRKREASTLYDFTCSLLVLDRECHPKRSRHGANLHR